MFDVLLINPPYFKKGGNIWKSVSSCMPPYGLMVLAACIEKEGYKVKILDTYAHKLAVDDIEDFLKKTYDEPRFIGLTSSTVNVKHAYAVSEICKKLWPKAKIIFGGVHATSKPEEPLLSKAADFVIRGEAEYTFVDLIKGKKLEEINGLTYFDKKGKIIHNKEGTFVDLDKLPLPAYHLLPMDKYFPAVGSYKRLPAMNVVTSRGCPGKCTFCYQPFGNALRQRSPRKIADEIKLLVDEYGIKEICFYDDNFTTFKHKIKEFCNILIDEGIDITWICFARVDWIDLDLMKLMKKTGCHQILFGAESASQKILDNIRKNISPDKVRKAVALAKEAGIDCRVTFLLGCPGETEETMEETIQFALELDPEIALFNIVSPNPGTQMYDWAVQNNYLSTKSWDEYDWGEVILTLPTVSPDKVKAYYKAAFKRFYLRPGYILRMILKVRTKNDFITLLHGFKGVLNVLKIHA